MNIRAPTIIPNDLFKSPNMKIRNSKNVQFQDASPVEAPSPAVIPDGLLDLFAVTEKNAQNAKSQTESLNNVLSCIKYEAKKLKGHPTQKKSS